MFFCIRSSLLDIIIRLKTVLGFFFKLPWLKEGIINVVPLIHCGNKISSENEHAG